ncbi:MAG: glycosyltransferase family A protein, partial [Aquihabitans sp.]
MITIVVMCYRNERTIVAAIASVTSQVAPEAYEVVVVTSGGDRSAQLVRAAFDRIEVAEVVESPVRLLPGGARNAGTTAASGAIVAFLAADCLAEPGWVAARLAAHRGGHPVVAGAMTAAVPSSPSGWASHYTLFCHRLPGRDAGPVAHADPAAHSLSFERSVLDQ